MKYKINKRDIYVKKSVKKRKRLLGKSPSTSFPINTHNIHAQNTKNF